MKNFKKILVFLILVISSALCLASCSCSTATPPDESPEPETPATPSTPTVVTYTVSTSIVGGEGGVVVSSTGSDTHKAGDSFTYTVTPSTGFVIETITINSSTFFTHDANGYSTTAIEIPFVSISKDYVIEVVFHQLDFIVNVTVQDSGFAESEGGTVVSSTNSNQHKGGSSPVYTITPASGYCIYSIAVDGVNVFNYNQNPALSSFVIDDEFAQIQKDHSIDVAFYKLINPELNLISTYYYTNNSFLPSPLEETTLGSVSAKLKNTNALVPNGRGDEVTLTVGKWFTLSEIEVSTDGENYQKFYATSDFYGEGFRFVSATKKLIFDAFSENVRIKTFSTPAKIDFILYDYDRGETIQVDDKSVYSYYDGVGERKDYKWFYSLSLNYREESVHKSVNVTSTTFGGSEIFHIYLAENMIADTNEGFKFILIYKQ